MSVCLKMTFVSSCVSQICDDALAAGLPCAYRRLPQSGRGVKFGLARQAEVQTALRDEDLEKLTSTKRQALEAVHAKAAAMCPSLADAVLERVGLARDVEDAEVRVHAFAVHMQ